jgi:hypothetical protein
MEDRVKTTKFHLSVIHATLVLVNLDSVVCTVKLTMWMVALMRHRLSSAKMGRSVSISLWTSSVSVLQAMKGSLVPPILTNVLVGHVSVVAPALTLVWIQVLQETNSLAVALMDGTGRIATTKLTRVDLPPV